MLIDFTNCPLSGKSYSGAELGKVGIIYKGENWFLKQQKFREKLDNPRYAMEHVASQIFRNLGMPAHETLLGVYFNKPVVAVKDFTTKNLELVEFHAAGGSHTFSTTAKRTKQHTITEILHQININRKIEDKDEVLQHFWRMFVVDALVANFDRHGMNWGFLKNTKMKTYNLAPVYDNGSSLYGRESDSELEDYSNNSEELLHLIRNFPQSKIKITSKEWASYYDVIRSKEHKGCNEAADWLRNTFEVWKIEEPIRMCEVMTDVRKDFLVKFLILRYHAIFCGFDF